MAKITKLVSLVGIFIIVFSNIAFAQYYPYQYSNPSHYEGKPIEKSGSGSEYYYEGGVVVYPNKAHNEEAMMKRFREEGFSEKEMMKMAKAKFGEDFSEDKFKENMMKFNERMERKESFSYENKGIGQRYYGGPSYEGYSKQHMVFAMLFEHIGDDIDPREIKQYCSEPEKMVDVVISKLKQKVGDFQSICSKAEQAEKRCSEESSNFCSKLEQPAIMEEASETERMQMQAYSCPVNKGAIIESCKKTSQLSLEQQMSKNKEWCEKKMGDESSMKECEKVKQNMMCDKEKFIDQCMAGVKKEEKREDETEEKKLCPAYPTPECGSGTVMKAKTDSNGCTYYYCEVEQKECPEQKIPECGPQEALQKKSDEKGCVHYYCQTLLITCPKIEMPSCEHGTLERKTDDKGCEYYYCKPIECHEISKPSCPEGSSMTAKYDDRKCVLAYECIPSQTLTGGGEGSNSITGNVAGVYEETLKHCHESWDKQIHACESIQKSCDKDNMVNQCVESSKKGFEENLKRIEEGCNIHTMSQIKAAEDRCSRIDEEKKRCYEESAKRCENMREISAKCRETLTEESIRKFVIEETRKRCKFSDIIEDEEDIKKTEKAEIVLAVLNTATESDMEKLGLFVDDLKEELKLQETTVYKGNINPKSFGDIKLLPFVVNAKISSAKSSERAKEVKESIVAGSKAEEAASKLASLRDSDVPKEYLYIIEDKASDVLDVSDTLEEIEKKGEEKGFGYKFKLFLGLAKESELEEIKQLEESKTKLKNSIETLEKLIDEVPSDVAKAILKEQVQSLRKQQEDLEGMIKSKEKKARGLFGMFG